MHENTDSSPWPTIRVPIHAVESIKRYKEAEHNLLKDLKRPPTQKELAEKLGISMEKIAGLEDIMDTSLPPYDRATDYLTLQEVLLKNSK